jgi:hypothetical protein
MKPISCLPSLVFGLAYTFNASGAAVIEFGPQANNLASSATYPIGVAAAVSGGGVTTSGSTLNAAGNPFFSNGLRSGSVTDTTFALGNFSISVDLFTGGDQSTGLGGTTGADYAHNANGVGILNSTSPSEGYFWNFDLTGLPSTVELILTAIQFNVFLNDGTEYARVFKVGDGSFADYNNSVVPPVGVQGAFVADVSGQSISMTGGSSGTLFTAIGLSGGVPVPGATASDWRIKNIHIDIVQVPEPNAIALAVSGLAGLLIFRRRY